MKIKCTLFLFLFFICTNMKITGQTSDSTTPVFRYNEKEKNFDFIDRSSQKTWIGNSDVIFICNNKEYPISKMKLKKISSKYTESTFGKGTIHSYEFISEDELKFGFEITSYLQNNWTTINGWVLNTKKQPLTFNEVRLIDAEEGLLLGGNSNDWRVLYGETDRLLSLGEARKLGRKKLIGKSFMAFHDPIENTDAVMGFSIKHAWGSVIISPVKDTPKIIANVEMDVDLKYREKMYAEAFHFKKGGKVTAELGELITATGKEVGADTNGSSLTGWCSWYKFNPFGDTDINEDIVMDFTNTAYKYKDSLPLQVMLIDDGYFTVPGDWSTTRATFPSGMKSIAKKVTEAGLIPGIWVAPSIAHSESKLLKQHPEWIDKNDKGEPQTKMLNWGKTTYSIDISNPDVLQHIDTLFRFMVNEWGIRYFKLDFSREPGPNRKDRSITPFTAMRNMYKTIRKAVGEDVIVANCHGTPYPPSIGYVQAGRVGSDVNPNWRSLLQGCRKSILHIPFHKRWWVNDPDCLNMRVTGSKLKLNELQTHLTVNFMSGGYIMFSDSLSKLPAERLKMLQQVLPTYGKSADIIDYMAAEGKKIPSILNIPIKKFNEKYAITAVFNWQEKPASNQINMQDLGLDSKQRYHIYDFWTDSYKGIHSGSYCIENLEPHSRQLLSIRPVMEDSIQIISSDLHILQGTMEIKNISRINISPSAKAKDEMWIELSPVSSRNGKLVMYFPKGRPKMSPTQGCKGYLQKRDDGLWDIHLSDIKDKAAIILRIR